jgi:hypothetical protein
MNNRFTVSINRAHLHHWTLANHAEPQELVEAFLAVVAVMICSVALIVAVYIFIEHTTTYLAGLLYPNYIQKAKHEDLEP